MEYTVLKPFSTRGRRHHIGDIVGDDYIAPESATRLMRSGHITEGMQVAYGVEYFEPKGTDAIQIPILEKDGNLMLMVSSQTISQAVRLIQTGVEQAIEEIQHSGDEDMLIILNACDSRKAVKAAAKKRAGELDTGNGTEKSKGEAESKGDA